MMLASYGKLMLIWLALCSVQKVMHGLLIQTEGERVLQLGEGFRGCDQLCDESPHLSVL